MGTAAREGRHVVILGGGFGGLYAARVLGAAGAPVTVIDRRNFHLFQPLLYQVATGGLSPGDIASPIRSVLNRHRHARVLCAEVTDIDPAGRAVILGGGERVGYDALIIATGSRTAYFGHDDWSRHAAAMKTVEDALDVRQRILSAFERAEMETEPARRDPLLTFVVVGGGPTGVELAGAVAELARGTLANDFRSFDPARARVILLEAGPRVLPAFPPPLSRRAARSLARLGVDVRTSTAVTRIGAGTVEVDAAGRTEQLGAATVLWAAGVTASEMSACVAARFTTARDRGGRIVVEPDLSLPGHPDVFVIGDLAHTAAPGGEALPGLAPVAMQQGAYVARRLLGRARGPFRYRNKGQLAVIGRNAAVCDLGRLQLAGFPAWLLWIFVHIAYLIEFDNRVLVMVQWGFNYLTRKRGARLMTHAGDG